MLHREGTKQAGKDVTSPLGKEHSIRGQTEEGCLSPVDAWPLWGMCQLQRVTGSLKTEV